MAAPIRFIFENSARIFRQNFHFLCALKQVQCSKLSQVVSADDPDLLLRRLFIEIKSFEPSVMDSYQKFVSTTARELDINLVAVHVPPKRYQFERRTLLKSVHVHKKHRRQYEIRTHYKTFEFKHLTGSTADTFLEYIERNLPEGLAMKVTKEKIEALPSNFQASNSSTPEVPRSRTDQIHQT